jgi:lipopolysaccharide/colanic/teichoic acid biosynthesis glycosyltransferase
MRYLDRAVKRALDISVASAGLVMLAPCLLGIAALIKLDSSGPVLFRQERLGLHGRTFHILKFRSMFRDAPLTIDADNTVVNLSRDGRVTQIGKILRKTSVDELPQLINILRGEMSLVGPRPDLPEALAMYTDSEKKRLEVKPGITGLAQVSGRNRLSAHEKWRLDADYASNSSMTEDLKILAMSAVSVLFREGVYKDEGNS